MYGRADKGRSDYQRTVNWLIFTGLARTEWANGDMDIHNNIVCHTEVGDSALTKSTISGSVSEVSAGSLAKCV